MSGAADSLRNVAMAALAALEGAKVHDGGPVQAALPYAIVEIGAETDWGHKSGAGRELRIAVTLRDKGERPERPRALMAAAESALEGLSGDLDGWRLVTMILVRSRLVAPRAGTGEAWVGTVEYRARMLET